MKIITNIKDHIVRPLGVGETWLALLHDKAHGTAQTTSMVTIEGIINKTLFLNSLKHLSKRYLQLLSRVVLTDTGYLLVNDVDFEAIPVSYLEHQGGNEWENIMENEANSILPQDKYLWRATLVSFKDEMTPRSHIILTFHHSIYDGLSSVAIFDSLLAFYNNPTIDAKPIEMPSSIESIFTNRSINNETAQQRLNKLDKVARYQWPHQNKAPISIRQTHFIFFSYSVSQVKQLKLISDQHYVSVNSMLNAAMLLSAQMLLGTSFHGGLSTAVSLRKYTNENISEKDVGFFCCATNTVHPDISGQTDFWKLAVSYQQQLRDRLDVLSLSDNDYDFILLQQSLAYLWDPNRNFFCYDFMVSNLGMLNFIHESAAYRIKSMRFGTCRLAGDNNMMLLVNSTRDGMFLTFGYCHPLITDEWARQFSLNFKYILDKYI